jgi:hypothetical protein
MAQISRVLADRAIHHGRDDVRSGCFPLIRRVIVNQPEASGDSMISKASPAVTFSGRPASYTAWMAVLVPFSGAEISPAPIRARQLRDRPARALSSSRWRSSRLWSERCRCCAQVSSLRSGNSSRTLLGTLHPSRIAFSTSLLCTRLNGDVPLDVEKREAGVAD